MPSSPPASEAASPSNTQSMTLPGTQVPRPFSPSSNEDAQIPATTSPKPIEEKKQSTEVKAPASTQAQPLTPLSSPKIPARRSNAAPSSSDRGQAAPRRRSLASLHSMDTRRSSGSSRSSNRSRRSSSSDSGDRPARKAKFDPLSTIKSEASVKSFEPHSDESDVEDFPQLSLEPQISAVSTNPDASSNNPLPSTITVPIVRPVSPPTQIELDNHVRVFNELDLGSMPPRKRSYTRHRYMSKERKIGLAFLAVVIPPLAVQRTIRGKCWKEVTLATVLWIMGYLPGVVYAISVVMAPWQSIPESRDSEWMQRREEQEETLRRLRSYDTDIDDQDGKKHKRRVWLLRRRFKQQSAPRIARW